MVIFAPEALFPVLKRSVQLVLPGNLARRVSKS